MSDGNEPRDAPPSIEDDDSFPSSSQEPQDTPPVPLSTRPISHEDRKKKYLYALKDVKKGMTIRGAAKKHGISYSALACHVKHRTEPPSKTGRTPFLSKEDEGQLVEWFLQMSKIGCPQIRKVLRLVVQSILKSKKKMVFPPDNIPSYGWVNSFLKRHPQLSHIIPEYVGHSIEPVSYKDVMNFFKVLKEYLQRQNIDVDSFLVKNNASRVFHCGESVFFMNASEKSAYEFGTESKLMTTVLFCVSASGEVLKPLLVNKGKMPTVYARHEGLDPKSYNVACSDNGMMTGEVFFSWLANLFHPELSGMGIQRPVILFLDGHSSYIFPDTVNFARDNGIIIYCLPPHASHILQPLDVGVFKSLKARYREEVSEAMGSLTKQDLPKKHFPFLFLKAMERSNVSENAVSGFKACGLVPFDPSVIKREKFLVFGDEPSQDGETGEHVSDVPVVEPMSQSLPDAYRAGYLAGRKEGLKIFEAFLADDLIELFNKRYRNKEDCEQYTTIYYQWRALKMMQESKIIPFDKRPFPADK